MSLIKINSNASAKFLSKTLISSSGGGGGGGPIGTPTTIYDTQGNVLVTDGNPLTGDIPDNWKSGQSIEGYVDIGTSATNIGNYAFDTNQLTSVTIPNSVTSIGEYAFGNNPLQSVTISDSVTTIGNQAFQACPLDSVTIGNSVETIGDFCFMNHSLTSLTIPGSVTSIGSGAFYGDFVTALTDVYCYTTQSAFVGSLAFYGTTGPLTLHVRASDNTWTAGGPVAFQTHFDVTIVKDL